MRNGARPPHWRRSPPRSAASLRAWTRSRPGWRRKRLAELGKLAAGCFTHLVATPHVVVRVSEGLYAEAREHLEAIARTSSFGGRLVVLAEPDMQLGDCRVEWADGGIVRERAATEAAIAEAVDRYLAVRRPAADAK
jgi:flagellar assembly protein FliH